MPIAGALLAQAETAQANSCGRNTHKSLQPLRLAWTGWPAGTFHLYSALHGRVITWISPHLVSLSLWNGLSPPIISWSSFDTGIDTTSRNT